MSMTFSFLVERAAVHPTITRRSQMCKAAFRSLRVSGKQSSSVRGR
ncbi:MAG: hypothetical protein ACP5C4_03370 [Methanomicrobiales archaeon]